MSVVKTLCLSAIVIVSSVAGAMAAQPGYGTKLTFNKGELYYTNSVNWLKARSVGQFLVDTKIFDGKRKTVQIDCQKGVYQFRIVILPQFMNDREIQASLRFIGKELRNSVFNGKPLEVHMVNSFLQTKRVLKVEKSYGERLEFLAGELYFTSQVTKKEAESLGNYLVKVEFFDQVKKTVQLNKSKGVYQFRFVLKKGADPEKVPEATIRAFAQGMSQDVFNKSAVEIHMTDKSLYTLKVVPMNSDADILKAALILFEKPQE